MKSVAFLILDYIKITKINCHTKLNTKQTTTDKLQFSVLNEKIHHIQNTSIRDNFFSQIDFFPLYAT